MKHFIIILLGIGLYSLLDMLRMFFICCLLNKHRTHAILSITAATTIVRCRRCKKIFIQDTTSGKVFPWDKKLRGHYEGFFKQLRQNKKEI